MIWERFRKCRLPIVLLFICHTVSFAHPRLRSDFFRRRRTQSLGGLYYSPRALCAVADHEIETKSACASAAQALVDPTENYEHVFVNYTSNEVPCGCKVRIFDDGTFDLMFADQAEGCTSEEILPISQNLTSFCQVFVTSSGDTHIDTETACACVDCFDESDTFFDLETFTCSDDHLSASAEIITRSEGCSVAFGECMRGEDLCAKWPSSADECVRIEMGDICPPGTHLMSSTDCFHLSGVNDVAYTVVELDGYGDASMCVKDGSSIPMYIVNDLPSYPQSEACIFDACYCITDSSTDATTEAASSMTTETADIVYPDQIVYEYTLDLELRTTLSGADLLASPGFYDSIRRAVATTAEVPEGAVQNIQLIRIGTDTSGSARRSRRRRSLSSAEADDAAQLSDYLLTFDIVFPDYQSADAADALFFSKVEDYNDNDHGITGSVNSFVDEIINNVAIASACTHVPGNGQIAPYLWKKRLVIMDNVTFFPIDHGLGSSVGNQVAQVLEGMGYVGTGHHDAFDVENHLGAFLAMCPVLPWTNGSKIIFALADTEDEARQDATPAKASDGASVVVYAIAGGVVGFLVLTMIGSGLYAWNFIRPKMRDNRRKLIDANAKLEMTSAENMLLARGWILKWEEIEMGKKVGEGVAGEVWTGRLRGSMTVAVKTIKNSKDSEDMTDDKEVAFMRRCRHPRLVLFLGFGRIKNSGDIFLVLEYMSEGGLDRHLWRRTENESVPSWQQRVQWLTDVADGMTYLHETLNCCHRDLKSPNVLMSIESDELRAKISDFGVSKFVNVSSTSRKAKAPDVVVGTKTSADRSFGQRKSRVGGAMGKKLGGRTTRYGGNVSKDALVHRTDLEGHTSFGGYWTSQVGTLEWLAPELMKAQEDLDATGNPLKATVYDQAVDQYSFGCVMYEAVELRPPWSHERKYKFSVEIYDAVMEKMRPPVTLDAPPGYVELMNACWDQLPSKRPAFSSIGSRLKRVADSWSKKQGRKPEHSLSFRKECPRPSLGEDVGAFEAETTKTASGQASKRADGIELSDLRPPKHPGPPVP